MHCILLRTAILCKTAIFNLKSVPGVPRDVQQDHGDLLREVRAEPEPGRPLRRRGQ